MISGNKLIGGENMLSANNGCAGVTSGSALGFINTTGCLGDNDCDRRRGCGCERCGSGCGSRGGCGCEGCGGCGSRFRSGCGCEGCGSRFRNGCGCGFDGCGMRGGCDCDCDDFGGRSLWGSFRGNGSCFSRNLISQLRMLYNTRVHITTFTCTLDVVLLDVCNEFIRVLDYCTGKIYLLRMDCICMIEQPIVPNCG